MALQIAKLESLKLSPENTLQHNYTTDKKTMDILWRDIQVLSNDRRYTAAYKCTTALMNLAHKSKKQELFKRCLLILARLSVLLSYSHAESLYKDLIKEVYTDIFVYNGVYAYSIDLFKIASVTEGPYNFIFNEYLLNIRKSKNKDKEEILFYTLIQVHITGHNPWDHNCTADLSCLPVHIRERYVEYTTSTHQSHAHDKYKPELNLSTSHVNQQNSKEFVNNHSIYSNINK
ncbi:hypothetical protein NEPAR04_1158 [Nematocida parisii]|nr:hypothetical protein NEPAR08_1082 [Nematocida parisii]KAI5128386.1 hypothetical protein NEPAR03_1295 [Nematocida parisii]KAI5141686.1 hypothetical protein NEPAR04_1158 [Nematocida parisii]